MYFKMSHVEKNLIQNNGPTSPSLMEVDLVVRSYQECYDIYSVDVPVTEAQLCADVPEGGKGICLVK
jgi:hypothetical protein